MGILEISPEIFSTFSGEIRIIDVRTPEEYGGPEGHIKNATLAPLGPDFFAFLETAPMGESYIFVCGQGKRSLQAAKVATEKGFVSVFSLQGGLHAWKKALLPVVFEDSSPL